MAFFNKRFGQMGFFLKWQRHKSKRGADFVPDMVLVGGAVIFRTRGFFC